jgi:hypothetical protein
MSLIKRRVSSDAIRLLDRSAGGWLPACSGRGLSAVARDVANFQRVGVVIRGHGACSTDAHIFLGRHAAKARLAMTRFHKVFESTCIDNNVSEGAASDDMGGKGAASDDEDCISWANILN